MKKLVFSISLTLLSSCSHHSANPQQGQDLLWLEEVEGKKAIEWVKNENKKSLGLLKKTKEYKHSFKHAKKVYTSNKKIPYARIRGNKVYNFWQDSNHVRGLLRETTIADYQKRKPSWKILINFDQLAKKEKKNWVYKGIKCLDKSSRCLVKLSDGGKDAFEVREFNIKTRQFIKNGFFVKEAKSRIGWLDKDHLFVATDFGKGTLTTSGYPRILKIWKRHTPFHKAVKVLEGNKEDLSVGSYSFTHDQKKYHFVYKALSFYESQQSLYHNGQLIEIKIPKTADITDFFKGQLVIKLQKDWKSFSAGSLISISMEDIIKKRPYRFQLIFKPTKASSLKYTSITQNSLLLSYQENVIAKLAKATYINNQWVIKDLKIGDKGSISYIFSHHTSPYIFALYEDFLTPRSLYLGKLSWKQKDNLKIIKKSPSWFKTTGLTVSQKWVKSSDGTQVPYFIVHKKDIKLDGKNPTLLYGYGGFRVSLNPWYSGTIGKLWLEKGGVFALANIRGGGEFGPRWHEAALKTKRQSAYDDFHSVAQDLIRQKITSPKHLGIQGGSNGGLLVGVAYTQKPDLYGAVVCQVPLLDMLRFHKLLAGASWQGEYGSPDKKEERDFLLKISPFHNLRKDAQYPNVFFMTSTKDDRVHPGHARKMAALMQKFKHPYLYYENIDGGHSAAANLNERANNAALMFTYLWRELR